MNQESVDELISIAETLVGAAELAASILAPGSGLLVSQIDKGVRGLMAYIHANTHNLTMEERNAANDQSRAILARLEGTHA